MSNVRGLTTTIAFLSLLVGARRAPAQNRPQWRGANRDGKSSSFAAPQTWPKELTQKWKVPVGVGGSSPALVGEPEIRVHPIVAGTRILVRDEDSVALWTIE